MHPHLVHSTNACRAAGRRCRRSAVPQLISVDARRTTSDASSRHYGKKSALHRRPRRAQRTNKAPDRKHHELWLHRAPSDIYARRQRRTSAHPDKRHRQPQHTSKALVRKHHELRGPRATSDVSYHHQRKTSAHPHNHPRRAQRTSKPLVRTHLELWGLSSHASEPRSDGLRAGSKPRRLRQKEGRSQAPVRKTCAASEASCRSTAWASCCTGRRAGSTPPAAGPPRG
mmetsp:Transcript_71510/g.205146  ORF Transcript_71510/g.205146 Transcript_71510/m.205146 type:complete len:228 (-) Transcript_71510:421-1104(-)